MFFVLFFRKQLSCRRQCGFRHIIHQSRHLAHRAFLVQCRHARHGFSCVAFLFNQKVIIRHRGKIQAIIGNARAYLAMEQNGESFSDFVWTFVNNAPQVTEATTLAEIPAATPASDALSKALKKRGFKFVGSTICYAFMQACGLVNDHVTGCFCHPGRQHDPQVAK